MVNCFICQVFLYKTKTLSECLGEMKQVLDCSLQVYNPSLSFFRKNPQNNSHQIHIFLINFYIICSRFYLLMFMVEIGVVKFILPAIFFCMLVQSMFVCSICKTFQPQKKQKKGQNSSLYLFFQKCSLKNH